MSLKLRKLRISVMTAEGLYGCEIPFERGLNVIHVENASGKSTCIQAIIYALGLEAMLGAKHTVPLPHAVVDFLETKDNRRVDVLESAVLLEIENANSEVMTVRRQIKGPDDTRLMRVYYGAILTNPQALVPDEPFFVKIEGSARRERGFHTELERFLGWKLPEVTKFDGEPSKLYLECVFPLVVVEQKRGWSGIQAAIPTHYQIRDVKRRAVEFLLDLDAYRLVAKRAAVESQKTLQRAEWHQIVNEMKSLASPLGGEWHGVPREPVAIWPPEQPPSLFFNIDNSVLGLASLIRQRSRQLKNLEEQDIPKVQADVSRLSGLLREKQDELSELTTVASELRSDSDLQRKEIVALRKHLESVEVDRREYQDLKRIEDLGYLRTKPLSLHRCPVCEQPLEDTLLQQTERFKPLSVPENIKYLEGQMALFSGMIADAEAQVAEKDRQVVGVRNEADRVRTEIRSIRETLVSDGRIPSIAAIEERVRLRYEIDQLREIDEKISDQRYRLSVVAANWKQVLEDEAKLPKGSLSKKDRDKLNVVANQLVEQLEEYGLRSLKASEFTISLDSYHPVFEQYDLGFELAASDLIRMVWAFLVALLETARTEKTNHPGLVVFDEPQQQNIKDMSFNKLLERLAATKASNQQAIIAISRVTPSTKQTLKNDGHNVIEIAGWVLRPMAE